MAGEAKGVPGVVRRFVQGIRIGKADAEEKETPQQHGGQSRAGGPDGGER